MKSKFAITLTGLGAAATIFGANTKKPNIIYFLADDLGMGELGCYGQDKIETPNIDKLAAQGVKFTNHYSGSTVCAPSRCTFVTGKHTGHAQVRGNLGAPIRGQHPLTPGTKTIASMLKEVGYATGMVGKWGLGGPYTTAHPNNHGFDFFYGLMDQWRAHNFYMTYYYRNKTAVPTMNQPQDLHDHLLPCQDRNDPASYRKYTGQDYGPELMIKEALSFVEENKDKPFFLYYATPIPHVALQAPKKWVNKYKGKFEETPYDGIRGGYLPCQYPRATYAGMVSCMDHNLGLLMKKLEELGIADNTMIVFTSDNGPTFNGGSDSEFFKSALNYRGLKCSIYEGGIRTPFIAKWPGKIKPGTTSEHLSAFWDMMPTFAEMTGANCPETDGVSMLATLTGNGTQQQHESLYWEDGRSKRALRKGDWKILEPHFTRDLELYNLKEDPSETTNLAKSNPDKFAEMKAALDAARTPSEVFPYIGIDCPKPAPKKKKRK